MAVGNNSNGGNKTYYNVAAGKIVQPADEGHPNAKKRIYTKEENGVKTEHTKWEFQNDFICGHITGIYIWEGQFGDVLKIEIDNEEVLNIPVQSKYFASTAERLKSIDLSQQVVFTPYDFTPKGSEKRSIGMSIKQNEEKVASFYWDSEKKKVKNGMPEVKDKSKMNKDKWKMYFMERDIFLKDEIKSIKINNKKEEVEEEIEAPF